MRFCLLSALLVALLCSSYAYSYEVESFQVEDYGYDILSMMPQPPYQWVYCTQAQIDDFKDFLNTKIKEIDDKYGADKLVGTCEEFSYKDFRDSVIKLMLTIDDRMDNGCGVSVNYCNGKPENPDAQLCGSDDVEVITKKNYTGWCNTVRPLTINRDECEKYFNIPKPAIGMNK